jgi:hypothetical protein
MAELDSGLHARTMAAVDRALRNHGVSLNGKELQNVGAELAGFVQSEIEGPAEPEEPETSEEEKPRKKRR